MVWTVCFNRLGKNFASSEIRTRDPDIRLGSSNRSATRTVLPEEGDKFDYSSLNRRFNKLAPFAYDGCMRIHQAQHVKGEDISLRNIMDILNYARACHGL